MKDEQMIDDLRERFDELGRDVPDRGRIVSRVRDLTDTERRTSRRLTAQVLGLAAAVILVVTVATWSARRDSGVVIETRPAQLEPVDARRPTTPPGTRVVGEALRLGLVLPEIVGSRWLPVSETTNVLTFALVDDSDTSPSETDPTVRIAVAADDRASTIADGLVRDLFDVDLVTDGPAVLGGFDGRQLKLATRGGTDTIGFRLGTGIYVSASGVDRRYIIHLVDLEDAALVLWLDAASDEYDTHLLEADRLFSSIDLNQ